MSNLDKLNALLAKTSLPSHRKTVSRSGNNLKWLRKWSATPACTDYELRGLLDMDIKDLLK